LRALSGSGRWPGAIRAIDLLRQEEVTLTDAEWPDHFRGTDEVTAPDAAERDRVRNTEEVSVIDL
jgi:hypothetical protein